MDNVTILPAVNIGHGFIPAACLPPGEDEYYLRNRQNGGPDRRWRRLRADEVEVLVKNDNSSSNWDEILVTDQFDPGQIQNNEFFGLVRIGTVQKAVLEHHDLKLPIGITNSRIISSDIGNNVAIHNVSYLSHYIIGDRCILFNINEMHTTNHAKFGNGIVKQGEPEDVRIWLDLMNESGFRRVAPFNGMISADAYLWAKYRDDAVLQKRLLEITQQQFDDRLGYYGQIGEQCVIKNSRILKDVQIGACCYIKGSNKLKNLTINSSAEEPTQIGEGVELVNGLIGFGCHIFYGCKAVRFVLDDNSSLKYGARLINSFLGANSTVSCCEVLNSLIFPAHEQHHNNSFLIAAVVKGQSNMAAGATIGSNHNSRANDNELEAGRGFWPGLCTSVKHPSRFASFTLLAKADYPSELDIPLPFALVNNNGAKNQLEIIPAFWWLYNMYAFVRNAAKFGSRDKRIHKVQKIEFDSLAPDTVEEIFSARQLLEKWTAQAALRGKAESGTESTDEELQALGRRLLEGAKEEVDALEIIATDIEKLQRKTVILKAYAGYHAYGDMLHYYAVRNVLHYFSTTGESLDAQKRFRGERERNWVNMGGQIMSQKAVDRLRSDIAEQKLNSWDEIHRYYDAHWDKYSLEKQRHAFRTLADLLGAKKISESQWRAALEKAVRIQEDVCDQVFASRKKDYDNPFRQRTFRDRSEMNATIGTVNDNSFIKQVQRETAEFKRLVESFIDKIKS
ncbi:DUF4954 family protein [candidate division KSB1 bacterium]|nr:DUF4954 family protein [candidate division KSB1 bacterium]RQW07408.1 MAG: DUF4954 family protein [candidate division KSB1 bacterium]